MDFKAIMYVHQHKKRTQRLIIVGHSILNANQDIMKTNKDYVMVRPPAAISLG